MNTKIEKCWRCQSTNLINKSEYLTICKNCGQKIPQQPLFQKYELHRQISYNILAIIFLIAIFAIVIILNLISTLM